MEENQLEQAEQLIAKHLKGWVSIKDLKMVLPGKTTIHDINKIKDYVNQKDTIHIRSTGSTATKSTYFIKHITDNPFKEYKDKIPENTHQIFNDWVGQGYSPKVVVSLILFLTTKDSRKEIAEKNDICGASITNNYKEMKEELMETPVTIRA